MLPELKYLGCGKGFLGTVWSEVWKLAVWLVVSEEAWSVTPRDRVGSWHMALTTAVCPQALWTATGSWAPRWRRSFHPCP